MAEMAMETETTRVAKPSVPLSDTAAAEGEAVARMAKLSSSRMEPVPLLVAVAPPGRTMST